MKLIVKCTKNNCNYDPSILQTAYPPNVTR